MKYLLSVCILLTTLGVAQPSHQHGSNELLDLVEQLRGGGLVLFVRHDRTLLDVSNDLQPVRADASQP